jgi:hypothetical protein
MKPVYAYLRQHARKLVAQLPLPDFYHDCHDAHLASHHLFETHPIIAELRQFIEIKLEEDYGHGVSHAIRVTLDSGALMYMEGLRLGYSQETICRKILLVQCAGLLHDIKRKSEHHAIAGAAFARQVLTAYPLSGPEINDICWAIRNHEAFQNMASTAAAESLIISDCLYDADKFRWGPDNFSDTVWKMVSFSDPPLSDFLSHYPKGIASIRKIKTTFRSKTGRKYGPQFIDLGLSVGEDLMEIINKRFI